MTKIKLIFAVVCIIFCYVGYGQDVEQKINSFKNRLENDPLKLTGSFNAMGQYYRAFGIGNRALPFNGRLLAAINFDFLGINMPFSLAFSNGGVVFNKRLPSYNFVGLSPSYKWAKIMLGNRTMNFGKYSFNNHSFDGGGFELTPGKLLISAFYGRLRRARLEDFQGISNVDPYYKRMGFGGKIGFQDGKDKVLVALFKAWDDASSISVPDSIFNFSPGENVILSAELGKKISQGVDLEVHYANSGFTADRQIPQRVEGVRLSNYAGLLQNNLSTRFNNALEAKVNFKIGKVSANVAYERIDPGYRTMGALFFNNDLENYSGGLRLKLFKNRMIVNGKAGVQRNNISGDQANAYNRFVGNLSANLMATDKLTFMASYSNFNNVNRRIGFANIDTLVVVTDLVLNNQNANAGFNYILINDNSRTSGIQGSLNFSQGSTIENDAIKVDQSINTTNINLTYYLSLKPSAWNFGANLASQTNEVGAIKMDFKSAGFTIGKQLFENKLSLSLIGSLALTKQLGDSLKEANGTVGNYQFGASYQVTETSAISLSSGYISNNVSNVNTGLNKYSEFRSTMNYLYKFTPKK